MSDEIRIQLAIGLPWVAVLWAILFNQRPNLREIGTLGFGLSLFGVIMSLASDVFAGARPEWVAAEILPGFALSFRLEPLGMLFALVAHGFDNIIFITRLRTPARLPCFYFPPIPFLKRR